MTRGSTVPLPLRIVAFCLVVTMALPPVAFSNPQGAAVRHGQVQIQGGAGQLQIRQMSQRAVIDWESFSIDQGEVTRFIQPGASSAVLNRVRGSAASQIEGMLRANGRVYLINPNGILIGPNGSVDVAGFVASTLDPGDRDFLGGGSMRFSGPSDAAVVNLGTISALDGDVVLMGASVLNAGEIRAPRGTAALAAGNDILLAESGEERVFVRGAGGSKKGEGVTNTGNIEANIAELKAHGGNVYGIAVKNEGRVAATGVTRSGGQIFLSAGGGRVRSTGSLKARKSDGSGGRVKVDSGTTGKTEIGGTIDASGETGAGGEIAILGNEIEVFDGTLILNDGDSSGGATQIGGGAYGQDPRFSNAETLTVGNGAMISANALGTGNGGEIILFANDTATINGTVSARGGAYGGNGGFIELSGRNRLYVPDLVGQVRLSAPLGNSGTLLLDPANITVTHGTGGGILGTTMTDGALMDVLANFPVLIWTSDYGSTGDGDITFAANVNLTWNTPHSLTFQADRDMIFLGGAQIFATGSGAFNATAARSISVGSGASIRTTNGNLTLSANQQVVATSGNFSGISISGGTVESTGTGVLSAIGRGGNTGNENAGINVVNGGKIIGGTSAITLLSGAGGPSGGTNNIGIQVTGANSLLSTNGSNLSVFGYGGGTGAASGGNSGVFVSSGGVITSGAFSGVSIEGTGGTGGGLNNKGVWISQSSPSSFGTITSGGGFVSITGVGGGSGASSSNQGVDVVGSNVILSTGGGALTVTGTAGLNTLTQAIRFGGAVSTAGNQPITMIGDSMSLLAGTVNSGTGITSIRPLTTNLAIDLGGFDVGGTTLGLSNTELDAITAGTVQIGNINTGLITVSSAITHGNHLSLTTGAGVTVNNAVTMAANRNFTTTAVGTINLATSASDLSASGTGAISLTTARNISLANNSSITTTLGNLTLSANATGTTTGLFEGVYVGNGASINSGMGTITITGRGGDTINAGNHGIRLDSTSTVASAGGNIFMTGQARGSAGANPTQEGLIVRGNITTTGSGNITLSGTGGNATSGNFGVHLFDDVLVSTVNGNISITGVSGAGTNNPGIQVADFGGSPTVITSTTGSITLIGNGSAGSSPGINAFGSGTSIGGGTGNIELTATGDLSLSSNAEIGATGSGAVSLSSTRSISLGAGTSVSTVNGNLTVSANQQPVATPGDFVGVFVNGGTIQSTGSGAVSVTGKGGDATVAGQTGVSVRNGGQILGGTSGGSLILAGTGRGSGSVGFHYGVQVSDTNSRISSNGATVSVVGLGGSGGAENYGVSVANGGQILAGTTGTLSVTGTGGTGVISSGKHHGVVLEGMNSAIRSVDGDLSVTGVGSNVSTASRGIFVRGAGAISTSGAGSITLDGAGSTFGIAITYDLGPGASVTTTGTGDITLITDAFTIDETESINAGPNTVLIHPKTNGFQINLGGFDHSGSILGLGDDELDRITAGLLQIGNSDTGWINVVSTISHGNHLSLTGSSVGGSGDLTLTGNRNLSITADEGVDFAGVVTVSGTASFSTDLYGIFLTNAGNNFGGAVSLSSGGTDGVEITDVDSLNFGTVGVGGDLAVTTGGGITQAGTITAAGTTTLNAGVGNNITLTNAGNDFSSVAIGSGKDVALTDVNALTLNASTVSGTFDVSAAGITVAGALVLGGNTDFNSSAGIRFEDSVTMAVDKNLTIDAVGTINLATSASDLSASGTGTISLTTARNISLADNSSITTTLGNLTLSANATGTTTGLFEGIYIGNGASITSGTGQISLTGKGGDASGAGNHGIRLDTSSLILSLGGDIEFDGTAIGASGSTSSQEGIVLQGDIQTEGSGSITITGRGGNAVGGNVGVNIFNTSQVVTENGTIEITGTSGGGADSPGIQLADFGDSSVAILSNAGNITIKGESPGDLNPGILAFGYGVSVGGGTGNVTLESTGTTRFFSGAKIDALGTGAVSITASRTIFLGADTSVTTENGNLTLSANQQVVPTPGNFAGIHVSGASVGSLGTGLVSLTGRGGDSGGNNYGVHLNGGAQVLGGTSNELVITGYGGAGEWAINAGVVVSDFGTLVSSLGGNVIISGTGGSATTTDSSSGVLITGSSTVTSGTAASVTIVGQGGAGANSNNRGVYIVSPFVNNSTTVSTGGGNLQITGTGGGTSTSLGDHGVEIAYGNSFPNVGSNGGTVTITGYTGPNPLNDGVRVDGNVTTTGNQNIQIYSNRLNITGGASINSGTGTTHILPISSGFQIDVGGADSATSLGVADGELDRITAGTVLVGSSTSGLVSVSSAITSPNHLMLLSGAGVSVQAPMTMAPDRNLQINAIGTSNGTISLVGANAALSGSGTGLISLISLRDIVLEPGSSISTLNGNISLTANQGPVPTPGNFSGIDLDGAGISSTGTGTVSLSGRGGDGEGGQHGIRLRGGASVTTNARNLTLSGAASDPLSSGLQIELASLGAGGGTIQLTGSGGTTSISSTNASATIGSATDTVLIRSNSGDVSIAGRVRGADLQVQDHSGTESVDFALTNTSNDINRINSFSNGSNGRIASLDFRDTDGFLVTEFLGASGISASGNITLRSNLFSGSSVVIDRPVRSAGGNVLLRGLDVVIDGTQVTATGSGSLTLEAGQAILVWDDSLLSVTNGAMSLEANRGEDSLAGNFTGITVLGSRLQSLGTGGITLSGRGGNGGPGSNFSFPGFTNPSSNGIRLDGGTVISSSDSSTNDFGIELYGSGGGGASDSVGIVMAGADTSVSSAGRSVMIEGFGGGQSTGQRNRGVLFTGGLVQASNNANITLFGAGGAGINENDGIQLNGNARVQAEDGAIVLDAYAGDTLGIGVILGNTAGDISITGSGSVDVKGTGRNAEGIVLGNSAATIGGINASYVELSANESDIRLQRNLIASGDIFLDSYAGDLFVEREVTSRRGNITLDGDNITIDAPVTATDGDITLNFGDQPRPTESEPEVQEIVGPFFDGTATVNAVLSADGTVRFVGGNGNGDTLTFAGYTASEISLRHENLMNVEFVVGTGSSNDQVRGPAVSSNYQFTGPNAFNVGGVAFSAFENVVADGGDDVFAFTGNASIDGALDGGAGVNRLDYSGYGTGIVVDLPLGAATGIVGGFENITNFTGSGNIDTVTGPGSASIYTFTGVDAMQVGTVSVAGFENLIAGPLEDQFLFLPGSSLRGVLDGGFSATPVNNLLDYSGFGAPISINLATATAGNLPGGFTGINRFRGSGSTRDLFSGPNSPTNYLFAGPNSFGTPEFQATGFENLSGGVESDTFVFAPNTSLSGNLSGGDGPGADTLSYALFGRPVTVNIGPNTAPGIGGRFNGIERILGSPGNDRFHFLNQSTIDFVDGGTGTDLIEINDSNLRGDNTYDINANSVSRNPLYTFNNFEALRLFLGTGNNTVNSGFFPFTQFLHGGNGFNTLNLPGVTTLTGPSPIGNVHHFGFDAPRPGGTDTGGLLQLQVNQNNGDPVVNTGQDSLTENRFSIIDPGTLNSQIGALGGAFSASVVAQAVIATVDGNSYLVLRPFSLDGSGLSPSNLGLAALNESLGVDANLELAAAIGFDGPVLLFNPDGPYSIDLSGVPADPAILTLLQESLSIAAAAELSAAIGLTLTVSITGPDGIVPMGLDGSVPGQNVVLIFRDQLGAPAEAELNAAIAGGN